MSTGWVPKSERMIPLSHRRAADASVGVAVAVAVVVVPFSSSGEDMVSSMLGLLSGKLVR